MNEKYKTFSSSKVKIIDGRVIRDATEVNIVSGDGADTLYLSGDQVQPDPSVPKRLLESPEFSTVTSVSGDQYNIKRNGNGAIEGFEKQDLSHLSADRMKVIDAMRRIKELQDQGF
jgi:hypothetical protein